MDKDRNVFGGWEQVGPGEYRAKVVSGSTTPDFANFAEQSRARWDAIEWLKAKFKQPSDKKTPTK